VRRRDERDGERVGEGRRGERMARAKKKRRRKWINQRGRTSDPVTGPCRHYLFGSWRE
jgi:hypothetical protein